MADFECLEKAISSHLRMATDVTPHIKIHSINPERFGQRAVILKGILSEEECAEIVAFIDSKDRPAVSPSDDILLEASQKKEHRNHKRIIQHSDIIATNLFERILPLLSQIHEDEKVCDSSNNAQYIHSGFGMHGSWRLHSLNSCFRLCKYSPSGHFGPHFDADYVIDPLSFRSLKTFMIYLNDDYEGGSTNFYDDHPMYLDGSRNIYCSPSETIHTAVKASRGDCLVFDHKLLHEGGQVISGNKYIMRSDLMYRRKNVIGEEESVEEQRRREAVRIYHTGMKLEERGDVDGAIAKYRRAIKLCPEIEEHMS